MRSRAGFTVVEILIVITILGIVSAVVLPTLSSRNDIRLAAAARSIISDITYAQSQAISTKQKQYVQFNTQQYALLHDSGVSITATTHPVLGGNYTILFNTGALSQVAISQVSFGGLTTLGFDTLGSPASYNTTNQQFTALGAPGTIQLQSGDQILTISIEPYTGEMSVSSN